MADPTKTVDGKSLPKEKFAYVGDPQDPSSWHLPIDSDHIDSALKMFGHEQHVPPASKVAVARKIAATAKSAGIDTTDFESKYCGTQHADFGNGWVEIFRAGDYGEKGKFSDADLDRVIANYDPASHEAPACIGHPKDDLPAYGWADRLMRQGGTLLAKFKEVDPAFESAVQAGRFKKRSAAFYLDNEGRISNLRHVAFLGAQPPEVKGLKNLNFADGGRKFTAVDFGEEEQVEKSIKEQIAEFFAEIFSGKKAGETRTFSETDVQSIATKAVEAATKPMQATIDQLKIDLATQSTKFAERETQLSTSETKQRAIAAVNKLKGAGKWIPAFEKMGLPLLFEELAKQTATIEFGEGDAKKKLTPLELLAEFMDGLPKIVPAGRTVNGGAVAAKNGTAHFTEGKGVKADQNSIALNDLAAARAKEKNISFSEALDQVVGEHPELTVPGGAQAGAV
jgi:hypothetical protein